MALKPYDGVSQAIIPGSLRAPEYGLSTLRKRTSDANSKIQHGNHRQNRGDHRQQTPSASMTTTMPTP
jgi:hypothetical protein